MPSQVDICNLALSHITEKTITSMTEKSVEAQTLSEFWNNALYQTLRDFAWPFATKYDNLSLVVTNPNGLWQYAYLLPSDCLYFRRILSGFQQDGRQQRVPYIIAKSDFINNPTVTPATTYTAQAGAMYIFTNWQNAQCEYTYLVTDMTQAPLDFVMALSFRLAAFVVPRLTGGDPFKLRPEMEAKYDMEITKAKANAFNEQQQPEEVPSEFERTRNGLYYNQGSEPPWFPSPSGFAID